MKYNIFKYWKFLSILVLLTLVKITLFSNKSYDIDYFLTPWFKFLRGNGWQAFAYPFNNYNPLYIYLMYLTSLLTDNAILGIKSLSLVFDFVFAYSVVLLVGLFSKVNSRLVYLIAFFSPAVIINSSLWGQCEVMYTSCVLFALYYIYKGKFGVGFLFYGLALSFKLQTIFIFPFFIFLMLFGFIPFKKMILGVIVMVNVFLAQLIVPLIIGRPFYSNMVFDNYNSEGLINIYLNQANTQKQLVLYDTPTLYQWVPNVFFEAFYPSGVLLLIGVLLTSFLVLYKLRVDVLKIRSKFLEFALFYSTLAIFLMPKMQERYFFIAHSLALVYLLVNPKKYYIFLLIYIVPVLGELRGAITFMGQIPDILTSTTGTLYLIVALSLLGYDIIHSLGLNLPPSGPLNFGPPSQN
jgi:Gpi18-like mannosyltransferase